MDDNGKPGVSTGLSSRDAENHVSDTKPGQDSISMTPEEEQAALDAQQTDEATEPADEGVGAHTDAQDDPRRTEN